MRIPGDKRRAAVVLRSDLLASLREAMMLPITSEMREDARGFPIKLAPGLDIVPAGRFDRISPFFLILCLGSEGPWKGDIGSGLRSHEKTQGAFFGSA